MLNNCAYCYCFRLTVRQEQGLPGRVVLGVRGLVGVVHQRVGHEVLMVVVVRLRVKRLHGLLLLVVVILTATSAAAAILVFQLLLKALLFLVIRIRRLHYARKLYL
jgi:hypothetical protein